MSAIELHPDLGPPKALPADVDGGYIVNMAHVLRMAREGDTPQCRTFYRAFTAAYRRLEGSDLSKADRELMAFKEALAALG